jgi:hypothetical protein
MVTKGALHDVLAVCSSVETGEGTIVEIAAAMTGSNSSLRSSVARDFVR